MTHTALILALLALLLSGCASLDTFVLERRVDKLDARADRTDARIDSVSRALKRADINSPYNFRGGQ